MRPAARTAVAALCLLSLAACGGEEPAGPAPSSGAGPAAARVGDAGSACELPVSFGIPESWKPAAVAIDPGSPLAELARRGPLTAACEIDAKPAGHIGFLRVHTGAKGDLRTILTAFIGPEAREPVITEQRIGGLPALEAVYRKQGELDDEPEPERAFLVDTGAQTVAVSLGSFDAEEHAAMLPAYELAKTTLTGPTLTSR